MTFRTGHLYPLVDADRFDDDFGEGYDHVLVHGDCDGMIITDAWPCTADGRFHPGYDASPIPVHVDGVDLEKGRPAPFETPEPVRGAMWR